MTWTHTFNSTKKLFILFKKTLRVKFFLRRDAHTNPLFRDCNILKFHYKIAFENSILIHKSFKQELPQPLNRWFELSSNFHIHNTMWSNLGCLNISLNQTIWKKLFVFMRFLLGIIFKIFIELF